MTGEVSYYKVLGIDPSADQDAINQAYKKLMRNHHPDKHGDQDDPIARLINEAHDVLSDPSQRTKYDANQGYGRNQSQGNESTSHPSTQLYERVTSKVIECDVCNGSGRKWFVKCKSCSGNGKVIELTCPSHRKFCPGCKGVGQVPRLGLFLDLGMQKCEVCGGCGLHPLPKVPPQHACLDCYGYGFTTEQDMIGGTRRVDCPSCYGYGVNIELPNDVTSQYGLNKQDCKDCKGLGYDPVLGPRFKCRYCNGNRWVPTPKKK